jgi:hypothetical protein
MRRSIVHARHTIGACILVLAAVPALAQPSAAGRVKVASGTAYVVRGDRVLPAKVGQIVLESDGLRTGADGALGVTLKDDTRVSLGPASEVRLESFLYEPSAGRLGLALRFIRGITAYVSGRIAKLAPDSIRLQTPAAIVGVRGTTLTIRVAE